MNKRSGPVVFLLVTLKKTNPVFNFLKWRLQAMCVHRALEEEWVA